MRTHLGASSELVNADQLPDGWTNNCRLLHCEGYCLYKPDLTQGAMQAAKQSGAEVPAMATSFTPQQYLQEAVFMCCDSHMSMVCIQLVLAHSCFKHGILVVSVPSVGLY